MPKSKIPTSLLPYQKPKLSSDVVTPPPPNLRSSSPPCMACSVEKPVTKEKPMQGKKAVENPMTMAALQIKKYHLMEHVMTVPNVPEPKEKVRHDRNPGNLDKQLVDPEEILNLMRNQEIQTYEDCARAISERQLTPKHVPERGIRESKKVVKIAPPEVKVHQTSRICDVPRPTYNSPINLLENKTVMKIFSYLYPSDLRVCREVQRLWNSLITSEDSFLEKTVFVVNIEKSYSVTTDHVYHTDLSSHANLPFRHGRFQYIDQKFLKNARDFQFRNSDNEKFVPRPKFLQSLTSLEFRSCFLLWKTIKSILVQAVQVTSLQITNCQISSFVPETSSQTVNEFEEFNAGNAIFGVKSLKIYEMRSLDTVTSIVRKFNGYSSQGLNTLKISYHPAEKNVEGTTELEAIADARDFCRELLTMIKSCKNSLRVLCLDIQHDITLDVVGQDLSKELAALGARLNLEEFQLSPGLECWLFRPELSPKSSVAMTMKSLDSNSTDAENKAKYASASLAWFLESQRNLETLGLPYMDHVDNASFFKTVLRGLPCGPKLKYLAVPSVTFLPDNLFHHFPSLKGVKIGDPNGKDSTAGWKLFHHYTKDVPKRLTPLLAVKAAEAKAEGAEKRMQLWGNESQPQVEVNPNIRMISEMKLLTISSAVRPDNFDVAIKNMRNLTHLEVNARTPVIMDGELQLCIRYLRMLTSLVISCADGLTDFGLTGIPEKNCKLMFHNQCYYKSGVNPKIWTSELVTGKPLSNLKGLRKLVLLGMKSSKITDIGVGYGLAFNELKYCHLPYSDYITDWGIEKISDSNPSLESFSFCGVNQYGKEAFENVRKTHPRLKRGDRSRCGYFVEQKSPFWDNMMMGLPTTDDVLEVFAKIGGAVKTGFFILARPLTMELYG